MFPGRSVTGEIILGNILFTYFKDPITSKFSHRGVFLFSNWLFVVKVRKNSCYSLKHVFLLKDFFFFPDGLLSNSFSIKSKIGDILMVFGSSTQKEQKVWTSILEKLFVKVNNKDECVSCRKESDGSIDVEMVVPNGQSLHLLEGDLSGIEEEEHDQQPSYHTLNTLVNTREVFKRQLLQIQTKDETLISRRRSFDSPVTSGSGSGSVHTGGYTSGHTSGHTGGSPRVSEFEGTRLQKTSNSMINLKILAQPPHLCKVGSETITNEVTILEKGRPTDSIGSTWKSIQRRSMTVSRPRTSISSTSNDTRSSSLQALYGESVSDVVTPNIESVKYGNLAGFLIPRELQVKNTPYTLIL